MRSLLYALLIALGSSACTDEAAQRPMINGDARRGKESIQRYECGVCHEIPGIRGANGKVGPALADYWRNVYVAGQLPNTPENLTSWIIDAHSIAPKTAMPALGISPHDARDIAAYLYSL